MLTKYAPLKLGKLWNTYDRITFDIKFVYVTLNCKKQIIAQQASYIQKLFFFKGQNKTFILMTRLSITKTTIFMIICKSDIYKDVLTCYILI